MKRSHALKLDTRYSYADYLQWDFEERLEIIDGQIFEIPSSPGTSHQILSGRLFAEIWQVLKGHSYQVFVAPFDVRLPKFNLSADSAVDTVVQPDISVVCDVSKIDEKGCIGAPDWIIEILIPGNIKMEMDTKFDVYEKFGVKEYWLVEPNDEVIFIYLLDEKGKFFGTKPATVTQTLTSVTLPDFSIDLDELFDKKEQ